MPSTNVAREQLAPCEAIQTRNAGLVMSDDPGWALWPFALEGDRRRLDSGEDQCAGQRGSLHQRRFVGHDRRITTGGVVPLMLTRLLVAMSMVAVMAAAHLLSLSNRVVSIAYRRASHAKGQRAAQRQHEGHQQENPEAEMHHNGMNAVPAEF